MTMNQVSGVVKDFFEEFERASKGADADVSSLLFHDPFMHANPDGVHMVTRDMIRMAIDRRRKLFKTIGWQSTDFVSLQETWVDERYVMVKADIHMRFEQVGGPAADFKDFATFMLLVRDEGPMIVFYHNHKDIMKELQALGFLPVKVD